MANKIRRCLYIGLGGTGMTSLLHTKKAFVETYGEVPPMIGFLGIDTDGGFFKRSIESSYGPISLTPNEQVSISVVDAPSTYKVHKASFNWVPEQCLFALASLHNTGAGQIRSNGRFSTIINLPKIADAISKKITDITNARIGDNERYELLNTNPMPEVHMVFSLCGGTGAGSFIDIAYLVRRLTNNGTLAGYAVLPDVFEAMMQAGSERVKPNAYGSLKELDYLMHFGLGDNDYHEVDYIQKQVRLEGRPFTAMFLIDNKNSQGETYRHVDFLAEMISSALTTSAGELSAASASTLDNLNQNISQGNFDISQKKGWVASLGASELLFRGEDLGRIYGLKAAQRIIERLLSSCDDPNIIANNWIDSPEVDIRENNGSENDKVIDFILDPSPRFPLTSIDNDDNAYAEACNYIEISGRPKSEDLDASRRKLEDKVYPQLTKLVISMLNSECGVGKSNEVLEQLEGIINLFLREMNTEKEYWQEEIPKCENAVKVASDELNSCAHKFFCLPATKSQARQDVIDATMKWTVAIRELARRNQAITFFNGLILRIHEEKNKVVAIKDQLKNVRSALREEMLDLQNNVLSGDNLFRINLAKDFATCINVDDSALSMTDFLSKNKIETFAKDETTTIREALLKYSMKLPGAKQWEGMTIDNVLSEMHKDNPTALENLLKRLLMKSSPLLSENFRGYIPEQMPADMYYIGVPNANDNIIRKEDLFGKILGGHPNLNFANIGMKDRVIIYHQRGNMPIFAVGPISTYKEKYLANEDMYHIDAQLKRRMDREDFSLLPTEEEDDTMNLWVYGLVFGKIRNNNGMYQYQNEQEGEPIDDYWIDLTQYRDDAHEMFRRAVPRIRNEYVKAFEKIASQRGSEVMEQLKSDVREKYLANYAQTGMSSDDFKRRENQNIRSLVNKEMEFVKKNF